MPYTPSKIKYNQREREVQKQIINDGWKVLYKGWPDFLCYKEDFGKISAFFIEVKRKPYKYNAGTHLQTKTFDIKLSPEQTEMHRILKLLGLEVKIIYKD